MKKNIIFKMSFWVFGVCFPVLSASPYAQKCERVIGVPVPTIDCADPNGSEVPVGKIEKEKCETPSHGLSNCNPGTKFIRFEDTFERDGKTEKVVTMIMCRKTNDDAKRGSKGADVYSDIGVIQFNETKNATCWFSRTGDNQQPTVSVPGSNPARRAYPSPSAKGEGFWGAHQPEAKCISCHQSGVWLRTPFASGVTNEKGKGYKRTGRSGNYQPGDGNPIPDSNEVMSKRGLSCSVGISEWNQPNGNQAPFQIKINAQKATAKWGAPGPNQASLSTCTRCHYIGAGGGGSLTCGTFLEEFKGRAYSKRLPNWATHFWMPPGEEASSPKEYLAKYEKTLEAVSWCCDLRNKKTNEEEYIDLCGGKFSDTGGGEDRANLRQLNKSGPCALCASMAGANDCDDNATPHAPKSDEGKHRSGRTH